MSVWSILLRVSLCVALMFNGATTAVASVQMTRMHAGMAQQAGPTGQPETMSPAIVMSDADNAMPCHQHEAQPAQSTGLEQGAAAPDTGSPKSKHPAPDCCKSGMCRCACMQHAVAAIPMLPFNAATIEHADSVRPMALGHAAPALPHLIRPPIG